MTCQEKFIKLCLLSSKHLKSTCLKSLSFHILYWKWHSLHLNIIPYKFCIKWPLPPFKHTINLSFLSDSDTFLNTRDFLASTTGLRKAHSCHKCSIHTNSALQYYAVWTFYQFSCSLTDWVLGLAFQVYTEMLSSSATLL